jgi:hypothetical protein
MSDPKKLKDQDKADLKEPFDYDKPQPNGTENVSDPVDHHGEFSEHPRKAIELIKLVLDVADDIETTYMQLNKQLRQYHRLDRKVIGHALLTPEHELTALITALRELDDENHRKTCRFCSQG